MSSAILCIVITIFAKLLCLHLQLLVLSRLSSDCVTDTVPAGRPV